MDFKVEGSRKRADFAQASLPLANLPVQHKDLPRVQSYSSSLSLFFVFVFNLPTTG